MVLLSNWAQWVRQAQPHSHFIAVAIYPACGSVPPGVSTWHLVLSRGVRSSNTSSRSSVSWRTSQPTVVAPSTPAVMKPRRLAENQAHAGFGAQNRPRTGALKI